MRICMVLNSGVICTTRTPMIVPSSSTAARISQLSPTSSRSAMKTPPTIISGALTIMIAVISTSICSCCTSLVLRVIRLGAPKVFSSLAEKDSARSKIAWRRSRPKAIAERAPNQVAPTWPPICSSETASMSAPIRQM